MVIGEKDGNLKKEYIVASENAAFSALGFKTLRDVEPGEAIYIDADGNLHSEQCSKSSKSTPCIFEYVYLSRPDSTLDEISVYKARMRMGQKLAKKILRLNPNHDIDVVIPIPDSSTTAALQLAEAMKLPYTQEFIKNRLNESLEQIGFEKVFEVDKEKLSLTIWFDEDVLGNSATDFFFKRPTEYSKKDKSFDEEDLF